MWTGEIIAGLTDPLIAITEAQRNIALRRLEDARLITVTRDAAHLLVAIDAPPCCASSLQDACATAPVGEAEQMQAERQPDYPLLYSLRGFQYCDLLLAAPERATWLATLDCGSLLPLVGGSPAAVGPDKPSVQGEPVGEDGGVGPATPAGLAGTSGSRLPQSKALRAVSQRAALYEAIPAKSAIHHPQSEIDHAVSGLRQANRSDYLPRSLITRAWLRFLTGARNGPESAQEDLDEAWEIAERGPMRLHMAGILLTRCRLFGMTNGEPLRYPWGGVGGGGEADHGLRLWTAEGRAGGREEGAAGDGGCGSAWRVPQ